MATWRFVNFDRPESERLADLTGIDNDLEATSEICDLLAAQLNEPPQHFRILDALTTAVLIRYARSFAKGVRHRLPSELITDLPLEQCDDHKWFIELRSKYVAHSVNSFEENEVHIYLVPVDRGPREISSVSVQENRLGSLGLEDIERLKYLVKAVRLKVAKMLDDERESVLRFAKSLPADQFYEQIDPPPRVASREDVSKSRKKR